MASSTPEHGDRLSPIDPAPIAPRTDALRRAADVMAAVRERCVWSARITHEDLVPYLVEESAELIDAVEAGTRADLREELGDLLWQVLFHAAVAADATEDPFDIDDVADALADKMIRRHPHVFGDAVATTPEEVLVHWNAAKSAEKRDRRSVLDGVSAHMPSLALAQKLLGRAAALPLSSSRTPGGQDRGPVGAQSEEELGEALLGLVSLAQERGWDAERALRVRIRGLEDEVRAVEASSASDDLEE
ncbi:MULTISPECIES: MazG family protein [unclassified Microbacterium]|uniref:MazG family protein n=1 Tax=unclassified Microbacterium TaxID=2609290 RepID=UPI00034EA989|nr:MULTISPECIES: MazG family protein [unclassified Microbacterium]EPD85315.1 dITP/XTP pyrophosphatase [Microbacterium sp. oral taxon 186 str. F0373]EXJ53030.1 pyrophosphatase [Microbacterium sp. MRS-1]